MMETISTIINSILNAKGKKPLDRLDDTIHLRKDLGFTSFDLAELTVKIEDKLNIDIFENGIVHTIGDIHQILLKNN